MPPSEAGNSSIGLNGDDSGKTPATRPQTNGSSTNGTSPETHESSSLPNGGEATLSTQPRKSKQTPVLDITKDLSALITQQMRKTPDAVALEDESTSLTYSELDVEVTDLANRLRDHGVGRDSLVGVLLGRSANYVIACLAALRAGGAFLVLGKFIIIFISLFVPLGSSGSHAGNVNIENWRISAPSVTNHLIYPRRAVLNVNRARIPSQSSCRCHRGCQTSRRHHEWYTSEPDQRRYSRDDHRGTHEQLLHTLGAFEKVSFTSRY